MSNTKIKLHMALSQEDCDCIRKGEEESLTNEVLQEYLESFNEDLDTNAEDYLLQLIKMAHLSGFYEGLTSIRRISFGADYDPNYTPED